MTLERRRAGDVLVLDRHRVEPDPVVEYSTIGVRSFGRGIFHYDPKPGHQLGKLRFFDVAPNRLVVSNIKGWEGAVAVSKADDRQCLASSRFLQYAAIDDRIDVRWARWFFLSDEGLSLIQRASPGSADRNRTLAIERFEDIEIPILPIVEQRRIAAVLDRIASVVEDLESLARRSARIGVAARAALTLRPQGERSEWRQVRVSDVLSLRCHKTPVVAEEVYSMAGVYSFGRGLFPRADLEGAKTSYKNLHRLRAGQLVVSRLKAWEGALALVPPRLDGYHLSPEFPTFDIADERVDPRFLSALLTSEHFWGRLKGASKGMGARKERVHAERLLEQEIELPSLEEQRRRSEAMGMLASVGNSSARRAELVAALIPSALNRDFAELS